MRRESVLGENKFEEFFTAINQAQIDSVAVSIYAIQGKSGFWGLNYKLRYQDGGQKEGSFTMKKFDGRWKIVEKTHWLSIALGKKTGWIGW